MYVPNVAWPAEAAGRGTGRATQQPRTENTQGPAARAAEADEELTRGLHSDQPKAWLAAMWITVVTLPL